MLASWALLLGLLLMGVSCRPRASPSPLAPSPTSPIATPIPSPSPSFTVEVVPTTPPPTPEEVPPSLPVRIVIPKIGVDAPVAEVGWRVRVLNGVEKSEWEMLPDAAGHHKNSARLGEQGNVVISGLHNVGSAVFRDLADLEEGDEVFVYGDDGRRFRYLVSQVLILLEVGIPEEERRAHAQYIGPTSEARLTLVSCWPYWTDTHRVVVIARPATPWVGD